MKIYNKLVRDRIPEIIVKSGRSHVTHIANDAEYKRMLHTKLQEEVEEFIESPCLEELADIYEVLDSIKALHSFDNTELKEVKEAKKIERGGFSERIILENVE